MPSPPQDVVDWFGDFRWFERPDRLSHEQCVVDGYSLDEIVAALRRVFPPRICADQVRAGEGSRIFGLFLGDGWTDATGEMLALGADLVAAPAVLGDAEVRRALQSPERFDSGRFEVGVAAGAERCGFHAHRPQLRVDQARPDWLIDLPTAPVAVECKVLWESEIARNVDMVEDAFSDRVFSAFFARGLRLDATFTLNDAGRRLLERPWRDFAEKVFPELSQAIAETLRTMGPNQGPTPAGNFGDIVLAYPYCASEHDGSYAVEGAPPDDGAARLRRLIHRVREAAPQFANMPPEVRRVVAILTGRTYLPAQDVVEALDAAPESWGTSNIDVDAIVIVNSHGRGDGPRWVTEAATHTIRRRPPDDLRRILTSWTRHINVGRPASTKDQ